MVFPIALRQVLPAYSTEAIGTKAIARAGLVTLKDLMIFVDKLNRQNARAIAIGQRTGRIALALYDVVAWDIGLAEDRRSPHQRSVPALPDFDSPLEPGAIR